MSTTRAPIILVPGYWLGAWAWDDVAARLRADGHQVTALTLPGLEPGTDASSVTFTDHLDAVCAAIEEAGAPVVLAVHSGNGGVGYAATDRLPALVAAAVYVDSGPATGPMDPDATADWAVPTTETLAAQENLDGISAAQLATLQERGVPQPVGTLCEGPVLTNDARLDVPTTVIATGATAEVYQEGVVEGWDFLLGLRDLRDVTWIDLPTSHWPMWSKPDELAAILSGVATR